MLTYILAQYMCYIIYWIWYAYIHICMYLCTWYIGYTHLCILQWQCKIPKERHEHKAIGGEHNKKNCLQLEASVKDPHAVFTHLVLI